VEVEFKRRGQLRIGHMGCARGATRQNSSGCHFDGPFQRIEPQFVAYLLMVLELGSQGILEPDQISCTRVTPTVL
jgi:hypothetical protein